MVTKVTERIVGRRQIARMIEDDPTRVVLRRRTKVPAPGGGWRWENKDGTPIKGQDVKLIPFKRRLTEMIISTEIGPITDLPYVLLGHYNMDIQKGDLFTIPEGEFEVKYLDISEPEIKVVAGIDYYGGGNNG